MRFMQVSQIFEGKYLSLVIEKWKLILGFAVSIKYFKYLNYHLLVENSFFIYAWQYTHRRDKNTKVIQTTLEEENINFMGL